MENKMEIKNVKDFDVQAILARANDANLRLFSVNADRETGQWIDEPVFVEVVNKAEHDAQVDTDERIFSTYQHGDALDGEERAVVVYWVN